MDDLVIIGAGPSGLAAAFEATKHGAKVSVLEKGDRVGGLARTIDWEGSRWDIGPHRFFSKNEEVKQLFIDIAGDDLIRVPRLTRIYYGQTYFNYPLTPLNALLGVGPLKSLEILGSYLNARCRRLIQRMDILTFEDWIIDRFGRSLYEAFFKTYTEKVWGIPCDQIGADWAAQRIKGLNLSTAVLNSLFKPKTQSVKTLVDEFMYPRLGAGQLYEKMAAIVTGRNGRVMTGCKVTRIVREGQRICAVMTSDGQGGEIPVEGKYFLTSSPLTKMVETMDPGPPPEVIHSCRSLRYRNHVGVNLKVEGIPFPDNWIYIHSKEFGMARLSNYRNFLVEMSRSAELSPLTVEYFTFPGDWTSEANDQALIDHAVQELNRMGMVRPDQVLRSFVVRSEKAYPVIETGYQQHIKTIRTWLKGFENLLPIGRTGMFKYNNQDHAMATGLLSARTALGLGQFDPWNVNIDAGYHEAGNAA